MLLLQLLQSLFESQDVIACQRERGRLGDFEIGPDDRMIPSIPFAGPLRLTARLDGDGNAMTRDAGDLSGAAIGSYDPGARDVQVVIDQTL